MPELSTRSLSISGYEIEAELARGGMASVYRARQVSLGRPVAIKVLNVELQGDSRFIGRFRREAELQAALEHPNIIPILDHGDTYIVMRLIDGPSLRELISIGGLTPDVTVELLRDVASALDYAHGLGALHQDVKPHNVLVEHGEHAWLADFGLTRLLDESTGLTHASGPIGTFDYLAPEIAEGQRATPACDIYALAVTAFQVMTGRLPFPTSSTAAAVRAHTSAPRPRASELNRELPPAVDDVLQRGMAIAPSERQTTAGELIEELRAALTPAAAHRADRRRTTPKVASGVTASPTVDSGAETVVPRTTVSQSGGPRGLRRVRSRLAIAVAAAVGLGGGGLIFTLNELAAGPSPAETTLLKPSGSAHPETVGGPSHAWTDYKTAGGKAGPIVSSNQTVEVACKVRGLRVQDGDRWWYRIASPPWNGRFYVSADAFYNNGETSGTLLHTPLVDPKIKTC